MKINLLKEIRKGGYEIELYNLTTENSKDCDVFDFSNEKDVTNLIDKFIIFKSTKNNKSENNHTLENIGNKNYKISKYFKNFVVEYFYDNHYKFVYKINIKSYNRNKKITLIRFDNNEKFKKFVKN